MTPEDTLMKLHQCVGRIEGKVDGILAEQVQLNTYVQTTSTRVGVLERARSSMRGWIAGAGAIAGVVGALVVIIVKALI